MLEVKNLTKLFSKKDQKTKKSVQVGIEDISFNAMEGRIFGLIGANGAGKTTTMRIVAHLTDPKSGEVSLDGKKYKDIKEVKKLLGFVSGETQIFDRLTPFETISLFAKLSGLSVKETKEKIDRLAKELDMFDFLNIPAQTFSSGMKQKVSIARALVTDPKVLVFDEVTNGLDIFAAQAVKDIIKSLKQAGKIVIYSTHIMPDADELCDDVAILHKGKILLQGEVQKLLSEKKVQNINNLFFNEINNIEKELPL